MTSRQRTTAATSAVCSPDEIPFDDLLKGIPGGTAPFRSGDVRGFGWNLLREDLPLPVAILKGGALEHNSAWMRRFLALSGATLAPHGKTTMSPQLFRQQLDDGAWAITLGTIAQVQVARRFGVSRIFLANQLIGPRAITYVLDELRRDPGFEFLCLVDSLDGVRLLAEALRANPVGRPLEVLLEGGIAGRRTGCRSLGDALAVARAVKAAAPLLALRGVEGFEGVVNQTDPAANDSAVTAFIAFLAEIARACAQEDLLAPGPVILSAGGSAYFDIVAKEFGAPGIDRETRVVIRSGCYLTHDSFLYADSYRRLLARTPEAQALGEGLKPALEVWAYVQSRPEPTRALLTMGKRDCSYDSGLPRPILWHRPGAQDPLPLSDRHRIVELNDQHAYLDLPPDSPLRVGDMVGCGISHPCLTLDKWQAIPVVDDAYDVVSVVRTYF